jgi:hypothetical protein
MEAIMTCSVKVLPSIPLTGAFPAPCAQAESRAAGPVARPRWRDVAHDATGAALAVAAWIALQVFTWAAVGF